MEDNKLISEFMGFHRTEKGYIVGGFGDGTFGLAKELLFHSSWDWLKKVVDAIEVKCQGVPPELLYVSLFSTKKEVYKAIVEFINRYNNQEKK